MSTECPIKSTPAFTLDKKQQGRFQSQQCFLPPKNAPVFYSFGRSLKGRGVVLLKRPPKDPPPQFVFLWTEITLSSLEKSPHPPAQLSND